MSYVALYRKFRPDRFEDVKGQDHIVTTLTNQIRADRIGHAYLFCGTRGTGKTSVAKILARAVNCESPVNGSPCNQCSTCRRIIEGTSLNVIEIDAASNNGVDNIREIREEVAYRPTEGKYKVYIIDEVHMLSAGAFNALLKTLEEPPEYVIFILATTEAHKIPVTILSRCQRYDFHRISIDTIAERLQELLKAEGVEAEEKAVRYIARAGDGSMRDALSLLDQCIAFYLGETLTYDKVLDVLGAADTEVFSRMFGSIVSGDVSGAVRILEEMIIGGREIGQFVTDFIWYLRSLLLLTASDEAEAVIDMSSENMKLLKEDAKAVSPETLMRYIRVLSELSGQMRASSQKRVLAEVALIRLCRPAMEKNLDSILDRIRILEKRIEEAPRIQVVTQTAEKSAEEKQGTEVPQPTDPPKAAPEELQQIAASWSSLVSRAPGGLQVVLRNASPRYDPDKEDGILYVVFSDLTAGAYTSDDMYRKEFEKIIEQQTGIRPVLKFILSEENAAKGLTPVMVDQAFRENIHTEIEYDDEPEDDFPG